MVLVSRKCTLLVYRYNEFIPFNINLLLNRLNSLFRITTKYPKLGDFTLNQILIYTIIIICLFIIYIISLQNYKLELMPKNFSANPQKCIFSSPAYPIPMQMLKKMASYPPLFASLSFQGSLSSATAKGSSPVIPRTLFI